MKKALVLILAFAMLLAVAAGCTQPSTTAPTGTPTTGKPSGSETEAPKPAKKIVYMYPATSGGIPVDLEKVNQAVSAYAIGKINVDPTLFPVEIANYNAQAMLMITGNEDVDVMESMPGGPAHFTAMIAANQIKDLTELGPQYAPKIAEAVDAVNPGFMAGMTVGGKVYGYPALFDKVTNYYVTIRKDVLDKYNLDLTKIKNGADLEAIVKVLAENETIPVLTAQTVDGDVLTAGNLIINYDNFADNIIVDFFGSNVYMYGAVMGEDNTKVINYYETDLFKKQVEMTRRWYEAGYINRDAATQTEVSVQIIAANGALGTLGAGELGIETSYNNRIGKEMVTVKIADGVVNSGIVQKFVWTIPVTCDEDEAALKFLELTYTDEELVNLINYGIKDEHYVLDDQGRVSLPEGVTAQNNPYNVNSSYLFGSQYLAKVWSTDQADLREVVKELNQNVAVAPLMGFSVNTVPISDEIGQLRNVIDQYRPGLVAGSSDPAVALPEFLAKLEAAGMSTVIAEVQSQVDAFVANR